MSERRVRDERPFKCNTCGNKFTSRGNLKVDFEHHEIPHPVLECLDEIPAPPLPSLPSLSKPNLRTPDKHFPFSSHSSSAVFTNSIVSKLNNLSEKKLSSSLTSDSLSDTSKSSRPSEREDMKDRMPSTKVDQLSKSSLSKGSIPLPIPPMVSITSSFSCAAPILSVPPPSLIHSSTTRPQRDSTLPTKMIDHKKNIEQYMEIDRSQTLKLQQLIDNLENMVSNPNQCVICHRVLSCKRALLMHYRIHTGQRPFMCKICSRSFKRKGNLKSHMGVHRLKSIIPIVHQCHICHKSFTNLMVLQKHIRSHAGIPTLPPMPDIYQNMFTNDCADDSGEGRNLQPTTPNGLNMSISDTSSISGDESKPGTPLLSLPLDLSSRSGLFMSGPDLRGDSSKKNTTCNICDKTFAYRSALEIHYRTHTKERPYQCKVCDRSFTTRGNMKQHMLTHKIPDLLKSCDNNSTTNSEMDNFFDNENRSSDGNIEQADEKVLHSKVMANKPLLSDQQVKNPAYLKSPNSPVLMCKSALPMHYRIHTGQRLFKGNICSRSIKRKGNLKTHMGVHRMKPLIPIMHQCHICHKSFSNLLVLQKHIRSHAGIPTPPPMPDLAHIHMYQNMFTNDCADDSGEGRNLPPTTPNGLNMCISDTSSISGDGSKSGTPLLSLPLDLSSRSGLFMSGPDLRGDSSKKNTTCNICDKTYAYRSALEKEHTKERPYQCKVCDRSFTTHGNIKQHMLTHKIPDLLKSFDNNSTTNSEMDNFFDNENQSSEGNIEQADEKALHSEVMANKPTR